MESKIFKTLLNNSLLIVVVFFLSSCDKRCSDEELGIYEAAEAGNVTKIKTYIENGGDPQLRCYDPYGGGKFNVNGSDLYFPICESSSKELVEYYLSLDIVPNQIKNEMFYFFLAKKDKNFLKLFINKYPQYSQAFRTVNNCFHDGDLTYYVFLNDELHYDYNQVDPITGDNILMKYAQCDGLKFEGKYEEELLKTIKYFVSIGVKINIKNKEGKTAIDLAVNPKVKEYLQGLD